MQIRACEKPCKIISLRMRGLRRAMKIWTLTDGKIGDRVQCAGVAAALGGDAMEKTITPARFIAALAPFGPVDPKDAPTKTGSPIAPPFPDVLIASGRRAVPYARVVKRNSGGKTFVVLLKDPRIPARFADLVWTPRHDRREGANVFSTLTSPHGLSARLSGGNETPTSAVCALPQPMLGVVLGGPSGGAQYDETAAAALAKAVYKASVNYKSVAVTPSRRTPPGFVVSFRRNLSVDGAYIWDGVEDNPYTDILSRAESLIVAADSHNMMSEAAATRAGVYAWRPAGLAKKLDWFVAELERAGRVRRFEGEAPPFNASPIDATAEIAAEIKKRRQTL